MRDNSLIMCSFDALSKQKNLAAVRCAGAKRFPPHHYLSAAQPRISISRSQPLECIFVTRQNASRRIDRTQLFRAQTPNVWDPNSASFMSSGTDVNFPLIRNERESVSYSQLVLFSQYCNDPLYRIDLCDNCARRVAIDFSVLIK
jgi:hypothetical protein